MGQDEDGPRAVLGKLVASNRIILLQAVICGRDLRQMYFGKSAPYDLKKFFSRLKSTVTALGPGKAIQLQSPKSQAPASPSWVPLIMFITEKVF